MGDHERARDEMLRSQLDIYGKGGSGGSGKALLQRRGKGGRGKGRGRRTQPEEEPDLREAEEHERAEKRRLSRALKAEALKRALEEAGEAGEVVEERSLLERLERERRSKRRSRRGAGEDGPLSITLWVYILFGIVAFDRLVKYTSAHADPVVLSKVLGAVLIVAAFGVKVPQIVAVWESKTVKGLSAAKQYTAVIALTLVVVYHLAHKTPFTAWGDSLAVLAQDATLVGMIWHFDKTPRALQVGLGTTYAAFLLGIFAFAAKVPPARLWPLPLISTAIGLSGTIPQIVENERNKHTGPQSFITQLMLTLGSLVRVFTTLTEANDPVVLGSFISSVVAQGILLWQILKFWANTKKVLAKEARRKKSA